MHKPLVSVVIPSFNHARFLGRALQSVIDQTYTNWEIIIVDNHSTDNTDEVVACFFDPRITFLRINNNGIIAASRNAGIGASKGQWIAFLDSDDWWRADKLEICVNQIDAKVDFIYHDLLIIRDKKDYFKRKRIRSRQVRRPALLDLVMHGNAVATSSVVVRASLLRQVHGMDEDPDIIAAEDYNTWLSIAEISDNFLFIPKILGHYMVHGAGISNKDMSQPLRKILSKYLHRLNDLQRNKAQSVICYLSGRYAYLQGNYGSMRGDLLKCIVYGENGMKIKSVYMIVAAALSAVLMTKSMAKK